MEIRNPHTPMALNEDLMVLLNEIRLDRGFNAQTYLDAKAHMLNSYLNHAGLSSVVVAVSGGIDSAVVLGIAAYAQQQINSPIQRIVAITLPDRDNPGVTGQDEAASLAHEVCRSQGVEPLTVEMGDIVLNITGNVEQALGLPDDEKARWCRGQATSYARTPVYYYATSVLAAQGTPGVVLGTTNLSEGGYLGYFGKASDGMVDLQMISDIYKSEVYQLGKLLNVPQAVMDRAPTGDMYDATTDEVVFGAPYDYVEIFQEMRRTGKEYENFMDTETLHLMTLWNDNLERMHKYNAHKYLGRSPAVHLDIMPCAMPGGWDNTMPALPVRDELKPRRVRGPFDRCKGMDFVGTFNRGHDGMVTARPIHESIPYESAFTVDLLTREAAEKILESLPDVNGDTWEAVGIDGRNYTHPEWKEGSPIGSYRASIFHQGLADELWRQLKTCLPSIRLTDQMTPTDTDNSQIWRPVGVADLMRVIRYEPGGVLIPHYDLTHVFDTNRRTLMSLVINLTEGEGPTSFLHEPQRHLPHDMRDNSDWKRVANPEEIIVSVEPKVGQALVFDHGLLHQGTPVWNQSKVIIRTDVIFERADWWC